VLLLQLVCIKQKSARVRKTKVMVLERVWLLWGYLLCCAWNSRGLFPAGFCRGLLAVRTCAKELKAVLDLGEAKLAVQGLLDFVEDAVVEFDNAFALAADKVVVVVAVVIVVGEFEAAGAIGEVDPMDESHGFEEFHGAVDCGEVTAGILDCGGDFLGCAGARELDEGFEDGLS
jgi:hypothetical protein